MIAEELRKGNLVFDEMGHLCSIATIAESSIRIKYGSEFFDIGLDDSLIHPEHLKPIPLTVEWLTRFGYSEENKNNFLGQFGLLKNIEGEYVLSYLNEYCLTRFNNIKIEYVHQLQSLFFDLTGKELEVLS